MDAELVEEEESDFPAYKIVPIADLIPYARNSRTHSELQIAKIASSIKEFGFLNPVITDGDNGILAGHGRVLAADKLGLKEVPVIGAEHLTEHQRRAYVIADNKLGLESGWDEELLKVELGELAAVGFDLDLTGFDLEDIAELNLDEEAEGLSENYSRKIEAPIYEVTGECPDVSELYDEGKVLELKAEIEAADLPDAVRAFLNAAADRHTVFDYRNIAEFYAHADAETQQLMEDSALVIVDFDGAVENGFVQLSEEMLEQVAS